MNKWKMMTVIDFYDTTCLILGNKGNLSQQVQAGGYSTGHM